MTKYCKLVHTSVKDVMHNPKHRGKCPFQFKCTFKKKRPRCKYVETL